jgi:hypothetical protein
VSATKPIGIVAFTKEQAEKHAARHCIPAGRWVYIPVSEKLSGLEYTGVIFDELSEVPHVG